MIYPIYIPSISTITQDSSWIRKVGSRTVSGAFQNTMRPSPKISNTIPDRILPGDLRDHGPTTLKNVEFWVDLIRQFFESSFFQWFWSSSLIFLQETSLWEETTLSSTKVMLKTTKIEKHTNPWLTNSVFACLPFHHLINNFWSKHFYFTTASDV